MEEIQLRNIMMQRNLSVIDSSLSREEKASNMIKTLFIILPPHSISDRTTIRNVVKFYSSVAEKKGEEPDSIFKMIISYALEASGPWSRVPAAVFVSILKKELGYLK